MAWLGARPLHAHQPEDEFARLVTKAIGYIAAEHITPANRADLARWAVSGLYQAAGRPVPPELAARLRRLGGAPEGELTRLLHDARARLGSPKPLEGHRDLEAALGGLFAGLEPALRPEERSCYIPRTKVKRVQLGGPVPEPVGVGLQVERDKATGMLRVRTPLWNGPAYRAGLRAGDLITHINVDTDKAGKPLARPRVVPTQGLFAEQADEVFLGMHGTRVKLRVIPAGVAQ
jgi:hypothetical protein